MLPGFVIPGIFDSDLMPPQDELVKLLLCKYELCKLLWADDIKGEVYKCDETAAECAACDDEEEASDALEAGDCKSYFTGELTLDECMLEIGDVNGYEAWDGWW